MTLGGQIIAELGRRGLRGQFFDWRGYCQLRPIDDVPALRQFLDERRLGSVAASDDPRSVAEALACNAEPSAGTWTFLLGEPVVWLLAALFG